MKVLKETTQWLSSTPNHVYFVDDSRSKMFGYVPANANQAQRFSKPMPFSARGRQFKEVKNQWNFAAEVDAARIWSVKGSKGDKYTVSEQDGVLSCSCSGFRFRGDCRHVKEIAQQIGKQVSAKLA